MLKNDVVYATTRVLRRVNLGKLTERQLGYIEGIIDGEGSFTLSKTIRKDCHRPSYRPILQISNTNKAMLEYLQQLIGGCVGYSHICPFSPKPVWQYRIQSNLMRELLPLLQLIDKEDERLLILEALAIIGFRGHRHKNYDRLEEIWLLLKNKHSKGVRKKERVP